MSEHSPTPWELIKGNNVHGPYIVNEYGGDVADLYAMSNPNCLFNDPSKPLPFIDADANGAFIVTAVNAYESDQAEISYLKEALEQAYARLREYGEII